MKFVTLSSLALAIAQLGCLAADSGEDVSTVEASKLGGASPQGVTLNGTSLNGTSLNGTSLNGTSLNGTSLNGTSLNGTSLNGTSLNGTSLNGTSLNGTVLTSPSLPDGDFTGTLWTGELSNGGTLALRIDGSAELLAPNADLHGYLVSYETADGWKPLCGVDADGESRAAIPMSGVWSYAQGVPGGGGHTADPSKITFACRGTAIAKCIEMGYRSWLSSASTTNPLGDHLVACTRMLRADFCGDGRSWTVDGTTVNVYDNVGVQADAEPWTIEAEWSADGAQRTNAASLTRLSVSGATPPACFNALVSRSCGAPRHFYNGALLMSEFAH